MKDPMTILEQARGAKEAGNFQKSLENYEWFFRNAVEIDWSNVGILSKCLEEWFSMGTLYPPARKRMEAIWDELKKKVQSKIPDEEAFKMLVELSIAIGREQDVINVFQGLDQETPEFAVKAFPAIRRLLCKQGLWKIISNYTENPLEALSKIEEAYKRKVELIKKDPVGLEKIWEPTIGLFLQEVKFLLKAMDNGDRVSEKEQLLSRLKILQSQSEFVDAHEGLLNLNRN